MFLIRLNRVFNKLCLKVIDASTMQVLRVEIIETMSTLEKIFPPACFDVMTHLIIDLVKELDLRGPIHTRWMYPYGEVHESPKRLCHKCGLIKREHGNWLCH
jgi:hypothetical protein